MQTIRKMYRLLQELVNSKPLSFWLAGFLILVFSSLTSFLFLNGLDLFLWVIIASITAIGIYLISPRMWIYSVLLSSYFFYTKGGATGDETSSQPIIFAMAYHLSLGIWMFSHVFLQRKRLIKHWIDLLFFIYLGFAALNCMLALSNGVEFLDWLKGWQLFLVILYYLPIRELFTDKKSQQLLLMVCSLVLIGQGIWNVYQYKLALTNFKYATQLFYAGIRQGAAIFTVACLATLAGVLYTHKFKWKILLLIFHIFCFTVLIISLSRASWVGYAFGLILIGIFAKGKYFYQFIFGFTVTAVFVITFGFLFFEKYADVAVNIAGARFSSSASYSSDPSYLSRVYENESLLRGIKSYPIGGVGLQKVHNRYDAITRSTVINTYAHNNYIGMIQKLGIPIALLYFFIIGGFAFRSIVIARQVRDPFYIFLATSSFSGIASMAVINFVGSVFDLREGMFLLIIVFAFSFFAEQELQKQKAIQPYNY